MSANDLLSVLPKALFVLVFLVVAVKAVRRPRRATIDTALLFGVASLVAAGEWAVPLLDRRTSAPLTAGYSALAIALPYLLVRLVDDFARVPRPVVYGALVGLAAGAASFVIVPPRARPLWLMLLYVVYFGGLTAYTGVAFARAALRSRGVTRRRMLAVAAGSFGLGLTILVAGLQAAMPALAVWWTALSNLCTLGSGLGYFVGFAPPAWLRWAWQVPELRAFLASTAHLPHLPDTRAVMRELERGVANALGAPTAAISLWDEAAQALQTSVNGDPHALPLDQTLSSLTFATQQAILSANLLRDSPALARVYRAEGITAALAAPITAGSQKRLGVLTAYAARAPLFADDGLELAQLLAQQVAVILESRALIDDLARHTADLHESEARLRAVIGNAPIVLYALDAAGVFTLCDGRALSDIGYNPDRFVGRSIFDAYRDYPEVLARIRLALAGETSSFVSPANDTIFDNRLVPVHDEQGRVTGAIGVATNVTERAHTEQVLRASEERFRSVTESAHDAIIVADSQGTIVSWYAGACTIFGYRADEVLGQPLTVLMPERYHAAHQHGLERLAAMHTPRLIGHMVELHGRRKDGSEFPLELSLSTWATAEGRFYSGIVRDITERKQAEQALERTNRELAHVNAELARADHVKSDFLATMSHEIRTPMNGVIGLTGLLLDTNLTPEQHEYAESVRTSGEALLGIINDILDFSKIEAGRLDLEEGDVDVQRTVEEVLDLLAPQAHARGLELAALVAEDVPPALGGDPGRLRQILVNLVGNAVKFTSAGEVVVRASVDEVAGGAGVVRFTVTDTGVGIAPEAGARLFAPFTQADGATTRRYGGTGLGLAISKRLAELMGGEIGVESVLGQGSTFWFTVRLTMAPQTSVAVPSRAGALEGRRVLVVDDNATNRTILQHHLITAGMRSGAAADSPSALALLRQAHQQGAPYDLVVLDLDMPGMDGLEVAGAIRADPALAATRLVLLASATPRERDELARRPEGEASLTKPVRPAQLYACLACVLTGPGEGTAATHPSASPPDPPPARPSEGRVLVVEDNAVSQRVAVRMLEKRGYRADAAANGREALEVLAHVPYDLVLMDCQMPEMDGYTATAEIRRRERARVAHHTPIIAMTANAMAGDDQACFAAGMDAYIPKPVTPAHLDAVLAQWQRGATPEAPGVVRPDAPGDGDVLDRDGQ